KDRKDIILEDKASFRFPVITNSTMAFFEKEGANFTWEANLIQFGVPFKLENVLAYIKSNSLENVVAIDATGNPGFPESYFDLMQNGLNVVSVNQSVGTQLPDFNKELGLAASIFGLEYRFVKFDNATKEQAADKVVKVLLDIAKKQQQQAA